MTVIGYGQTKYFSFSDWLHIYKSKWPWHVTQPLPALHKYGMVVYFPGLDWENIYYSENLFTTADVAEELNGGRRVEW